LAETETTANGQQVVEPQKDSGTRRLRSLAPTGKNLSTQTKKNLIHFWQPEKMLENAGNF